MPTPDLHAQPAWPVLRLLRSGTSFWTMILAFLAVTSIYITGRVLDLAWTSAGQGVVEINRTTEVSAFASGSGALRVWRQRADASADADKVGPFTALIRHESRCIGQMVRGVATGKILFSQAGSMSIPGLAGLAGLRDSEPGMPLGAPSLLDGLVNALAGLGWLLVEAPLYAALFIGIALAILAFFGMGICRFHAIRTTQNETAAIGDVMRFTREKWMAAVAAPLLPLILLVLVSVVLMLIGLIGAIPVLGEWFAALSYGLALFAGVAIAFCALAAIFGFPLMWPTIAVEGSDSFDAVQHSAGYLFQRPGTTTLYGLVLLAIVSISYLFARLFLMLVLKLTHVVTSWGIGAFGAVASAASPEDAANPVGKLEGMWRMPDWADLPLLPGATPFWGVFDPTGELTGSQGYASVVIAFWVFCMVGLLIAFVLNSLLAGWVELYLVLRHQIDAVEYDFIFCEELEEDEIEAGGTLEPPAGDLGASPAADG